jgi:aminopeptidase N
MAVGKSLRTTLILLLFLVCLPQITAAPTADVLHYTIALEVMPHENVVYGTTGITLNATNLETLTLHLDEDLGLKSVLINSGSLNFSRENKTIKIAFRKPLQGVNELLLEYEGVLEEMVDGHSWAYMDEESVYAVHESSWYPNVANDRASAVINLQVPDSLSAISNGAILAYLEDTNSYLWEVESSEAGFSFAAGRYLEVKDYQKHRTVSCFLLAPKERCVSTLLWILEFFSSTLTDYPYPKLAVTEVTGTLNGGHGDNSLIIMSSAIIRGPKFEEFLAHETAHSWFGGLVTSKDSKWLTEGFATYAAVMYLESKDEELSKRSLDAKRSEYMKIRDNNEDIAILSLTDEYDDVFHATVYSKGAYVLHMLRYVVGDEAFLKTLENYVEAYGEKSAGVEDFIKVAEETSGMELDWFFEEWLESTLFPDFWIDSAQVKRIGNSYNVSVVLMQGEDRVKMPVDVTLMTKKGEVTKRTWIDSTSSEVEFETKAEPIFVEVDRKGWLLEREKSNNRHVIRYPLSYYGLRLFFTNLMQRLDGVGFLKPKI